MDTLRVTVDGEDHDLSFDDCTAIDAKECRQQTGMSLSSLIGAAGENPDLDSIAALVWLSHRQAGRRIPYETVARGITYGSKFEIASLNGTDPDPGE